MRVTIRTEEFKYAAGLFKREPRWKVICNIEFSAEELAIIRQRNLGDVHVFTQQLGGEDEFPISLAMVVKEGIWSVYHTPVDAKNFEHELTTELLPALKNYLTASADVESGDRVLEF
jgi:hypothetical protein